MRIGSLFSGIGGLELGLEWAGVGHTVWQVEQDPFCRAVLAHHWPDAVRHNDVRTVGAHNLEPVDVICGGFPCQDISYAGKGAGLSGERSGLWSEFARIVGELGPQFVVVENVAALLTRGIDAVLGTLADLGYDAEWSTLRASDVGAPHRRERVFIVAHARRERDEQRMRSGGAPRAAGAAAGEARQWERGGGHAGIRGKQLHELADACGEHRPQSDRGAHEPGQHASRRGDDPRRGTHLGDAASGGRGTGTGLDVRRAAGGRAGLGDTERERGRGGREREHAGDACASSEVVSWRDAVPVRGADGTVRLIPREALAENGIKPYFRGVVDGVSAWVDHGSMTTLTGVIAAYGEESGSSAAEVLRALWRAAVSAPLQWHPGRKVAVHEEAFLFALLRQYARRCGCETITSEGPCIDGSEQQFMRSLRELRSGSRPSRERKRARQQARQSSAALQVVSSVLAQTAREAWQDTHKQNAESLPLWPVVESFPGRVARLRAIGNAVVPQCAAVVGRRLLAIANEGIA